MSRVALPVIRDHFRLQADMTAWVATAFMLPFMILMPVYGGLSDCLGKRRLILAGIFIFSIGTAMATLAPDLSWLMAGRAIQGIGVGGIMPLGMALISTIFPLMNVVRHSEPGVQSAQQLPSLDLYSRVSLLSSGGGVSPFCPPWALA